VNERSILGHTGKPQDVASLVSYLASKESYFITGESMNISGIKGLDSAIFPICYEHQDKA
jgi:NAD(P)-dependent dehydrogenase (short-subunit alcohol dehydrogenase family)